MSGSYVGAYWGVRHESVDQAAQRLARLLRALADVDPALSHWRKGGQSKRQALAQPLVTVDHADLVSRLLAGRNRTDVGQQVIEELGYSVYWWNSVDDYRAVAKLSAGLGMTSPYGSNRVVLNLPDEVAMPGVYTEATARKLLHTLIDVCEPDWAVWSNNDLCDEQAEPDRPTEDGRGYIAGTIDGHPAGWANYLSDTDTVKFDRGLLPASANVEQVGTGTLVTLGNNPADPQLEDVLAVRLAMGYQVSGAVSVPSAGLAAPSVADSAGRAPVGNEGKQEQPRGLPINGDRSALTEPPLAPRRRD